MRTNTVSDENGRKSFVHLMESDETGGIFRLAAKITLDPGTKVMPHEHENEGEIYIIISGTATADDNGTIVTLKSGDIMWTADGNYHAISNETDEPMVMYAIIAKK